MQHQPVAGLWPPPHFAVLSIASPGGIHAWSTRRPAASPLSQPAHAKPASRRAEAAESVRTQSPIRVH